MRATYLLIAISGLCFFLGGWFLAMKYSPEPAIPTLSNDTDRLETRINQLTLDIAHLKKKISATEEAQPNITEKDGSQEIEGHVKRDSNLVQRSLPINQEELTLGFQTPKKTTGDVSESVGTTFVDLPNTFSSEVRNHEWAFAREQELQNLLARDHYFQGQELSAIECKSSSCRAQFHVSGKEQKMEIASRLNRIFVTQTTIDFSPQIMIGKTNSEQLTDFYFREASPEDPVQ